ncbi:per-os infectivity factor 2 [Neodiprion sertifer nucleopolyhedrovirus]|uniref:ORF22 n=1 Tax=Neodiprion sertifer nucleopolyhedrovirus TaxID=111874 RepID=Q9QAB4_9CBAC|nr:per-os infectivity factor 2 [Neodiprion sertifer nucleopolyhedrovirus]AAF24988.1 ORF22 [Neodiprion sertifer nucleopolyhedrovirus]AAQ96432.1 per-os infectivity factor 2 [Neodiprion sertifer nucleopolyhedrovirus]
MLFYFIVITILVLLGIYIFTKPLLDTIYVIQTAQTKYVDTIDENVEAIEKNLAESRYVPLENLANIDINNSTELMNGENKCFAAPIRVSNVETSTFDCTTVCENESASYFFVDENDIFVINGSRLSSGGYCSTTALPTKCNRETSIVLYSVNTWTCIAEDPRFFAGESNSVQIAGRQHSRFILSGYEQYNILYDKLLENEVDITRNTLRTSWDELLDDGTRRFVVLCNALDVNYNEMFVNPYNEIECLPNVCTNVQYAHRDVKPDFVNGVCDCGDYSVTRMQHVTSGDETSLCANIINESDYDNNVYKFRSDCLKMTDVVSKLETDGVRLFCPPDVFNTTGDAAYQVEVKGFACRTNNGVDELTYRLENDFGDRLTYINDRIIS